MKKAFVIVIAVYYLSIGLCQGELNDSLKNIYFGFANEQGAQINANQYGGYEIKEPEKLKTAICPNGKVLNISFLEYRKESPKTNGRQNSRNFDNCGGYYYKLVNGITEDDASCMLVEPKFIKEWQVLSFESKKILKPSKSNIDKIEQFKKLKIHDIQTLAKFGDDNYLYFTLFTTNSDHYLADVILIKDNLLYEDSPGNKVNFSEEYQCSFTNLGFSEYCQVLNILTNGKDILFLLFEHTEEGKHVTLVMAQEKKLISIQSSSRYTYPVD
jgi:hypothetical protein